MVYQTWRTGGAFSYALTSLTPGASYTVRLHFAEPSYNNAGQRRFNVGINNAPVLTNFDIVAAAGGRDKAVVRSFAATADNTGQIVLTFTQGAVDYPLVNVIEVLSGSTVVQAINCGEVAGGTLTVNPATWSNNGTLWAGSGGIVNLRNTWSTTGTMAAQLSAQSQWFISDTAPLDGNLALTVGSGFTPQVGDRFTIINNQGSSPVTGTFNGLPEGSLIWTNAGGFQISYKGGDGNDVVVTRVQGASITTLLSSINPSLIGQSLTLTATIGGNWAPGGGSPTGTVTFQDNGICFGTVGLSQNGMAMLLTSSLAAGNHTVTAVYGGDSNFTGSTSANFLQTVNQASTTTIVSPSNQSSVLGEKVTFTATVISTYGTPIGTITFQDNGISMGTSALPSGGTTTFSTSTLAIGKQEITAVYGGDTNFSSSTSATITHTVNPVIYPLATDTSVVASINPSSYGHSVVFSLMVTSSVGVPTGTVTLVDGGASLGTATLSPTGQAFFSTAVLNPGRIRSWPSMSATVPMLAVPQRLLPRRLPRRAARQR